MTNTHPIHVPTDQELRERSLNALKQTRLYANVSRRLLADLVDLHPPVTVTPGAGLAKVRPLVLIVLEGNLALHGGQRPVALRPGTYLGYDAAFADVDWERARLEAVGGEARFFVLDPGSFDAQPLAIVNALDPAELEALNEPTRPETSGSS